MASLTVIDTVSWQLIKFIENYEFGFWFMFTQGQRSSGWRKFILACNIRALNGGAEIVVSAREVVKVDSWRKGLKGE